MTTKAAIDVVVGDNFDDPHIRGVVIKINVFHGASRSVRLETSSEFNNVYYFRPRDQIILAEPPVDPGNGEG